MHRVSAKGIDKTIATSYRFARGQGERANE